MAAKRYAGFALFVAVLVSFLPVAFLHAAATAIMLGVYSLLDSLGVIIHE